MKQKKNKHKMTNDSEIIEELEKRIRRLERRQQSLALNLARAEVSVAALQTLAPQTALTRCCIERCGAAMLMSHSVAAWKCVNRHPICQACFTEIRDVDNEIVFHCRDCLAVVMGARAPVTVDNIAY